MYIKPPQVMDTNKSLYYTDEYGVSITRSELHVKNSFYPLSGINTHKLGILQPHRVLFVTPIVSGSLFFICGAIDLLPMMSESVSVFGIIIHANAAVMLYGLAILLLGMVIMYYSHEKYAVRISTDYGERDAVISNRKEYINQIIDGLNHAFIDAARNAKPGYKLYSPN